MQNVRALNNSARSTSDVYNPEGISKLLNFTDYPNQYVDYNSEEHYLSPHAIRQYLSEQGIQNAGLFNPTAGYQTPSGENIYGVYDFGRLGQNNPWGFRSPFYLIVGNDGKLKLGSNGNARFSSVDYPAIDAIWQAMEQPSTWQDFGDGKGKYYGLYTTVEGSDISNGKPSQYQIFEGKDGKFYHRYNDRTIVELSPELLEAIANGHKPTRQQMSTGALADEKKDPYRPRVITKTGSKDTGIGQFTI